MSPRSWATLENLRTADGQPVRRPKAIENTVFRPTTTIPNNLGAGENESIIVLGDFADLVLGVRLDARSEEHTSELQSLMRISYAVICWKKKNHITIKHT